MQPAVAAALPALYARWLARLPLCHDREESLTVMRRLAAQLYLLFVSAISAHEVSIRSLPTDPGVDPIEALQVYTAEMIDALVIHTSPPAICVLGLLG